MVAALFGLEVFLITALIFLAVAMASSAFGDAPFVPTGNSSVRKIMEIVRVKPGEIFYDLGSGDGRLVRAAARAGARAYGFERVRLLALWGNLLPRLQGMGDRAVGRRGNFFAENFGDADIVFVYLFPEAMIRLEEKCRRELKPGARVISRAFTFPGWPPEAVFRFGKYNPPLYVYRKTATVAPEAFLS